MPVIITADKPEELPEGLRPAAKDIDGKFVVEKLPEGWGVDNVGAYRQKLTKAEQDAKRREDRLAQYRKDEQGNLWEPDEIKAAFEEAQKLKAERDKAPNLDEIRRQYSAEYEKQWRPRWETEKKRADDLDSQLDRMLLQSEINDVLAQTRPKDGKAELLQSLLLTQFAVDRSNGKRAVRVRSSDGFVPGNDEDGFMKPLTWALNVLKTKHADLFVGDDQSGAGVSGSSGVSGRGVYKFPRAELQRRAQDYTALVKKAKSEGKTVELV